MGKRINTLNTASSPANDDYLPIDGATNGTRKISADFVNNLITDVEVDGTSVVTSGVAEIDLSGKQDTLTAGSNIQIAQDGTISATDTTYTAGTNVQIDNGVISATDTTYTAGTNVDITNGVISATDTTYTAGTGIDITNGVISSNVTPGSTVSVTQKTSTGTNIADITVDGVTTQLYAPNGGGGGSTVIPNPTGTPTDTLDTVSIDGTIYEIQGGGSSAIQLTQAEYDALTQEEKENGTIYFVATTTSQLIPRVSGTDSAITSSGKTRYNGGENWHAFDGVEDISGIANCWVADEDNTSAYIQYHFSQPYYLMQLQLKLYSHYSEAWTGTLNVLGSNDGSNWTNISSTGQSVNVTAPLNKINTEVIDLNSNDAWDYIRVQANGTAFNIAYQPCCDFSEIYVYGSSTPIVVENHDIYYMGDKYTNNSGGGVVMTGATSSVNGTQGEAPQPLAGDQEKVLTGAGTWTSLDNIGTSQIYLGDLIPRVTSSDTHITASSEGTYGSTIWSAWGALTTDISIQNVPASNSAWVNANGDSAPWIMYYFDESRYFTEVEIKAFSNYGSDFSGTIYIEASNDASAWTDIGGGAKTINAALSTLTTNTYSISNNNSWRYIRIRGTQSFFELSNPACFFQSLQVKGGKAGGGIVQYIDFSSLSSQQVEDLQNKISGGSRTYLGQLIPRVSAADYKITASTSSGAETKILNYSTLEQNTGLTWIDGKPIFQKTIYYAPAVSSIATIDSSLNTSNVGYFVCTELSYVCDNLYRGSGLPIEIGITSSGVIEGVNHASGASITETYATIRYTKVLTS